VPSRRAREQEHSGTGRRTAPILEKTMGELADLRAKIDTLHSKLNEFYALDDSWRELGEWPEGVTGSVLHPPATDEEIAHAEVRAGHKFPPSYKMFLRLHSAWEHFWGDFTLVGTCPLATHAKQEEIAENIEYQTEKLKRKFGENFSPETIKTWESEETRNLFLANHIVIATDVSGAHWVFDTRKRGENQELKLTMWNISYGAQDPTFNRFEDFIDFAIGEVGFRLENLRRGEQAE
jgi:hypothetical protein